MNVSANIGRVQVSGPALIGLVTASMLARGQITNDQLPTATAALSYMLEIVSGAKDEPESVDHIGDQRTQEAMPAVRTEGRQLSNKEIKATIQNGGETLLFLEDGRPYKALKRPLERLGLTPEDYRAKWGLPDDYPMNAPKFSERRAEMARQMGLGQRGRGRGRNAPAVTETAARGRRSPEPSPKKGAKRGK